MATESRLSTVWKFFGKAPANDFRPVPGTITSFRDEWKGLSDKDKDELEKGIADGTLTY